MDLQSVVDELYGVVPERFTALRNDRAAQARKAGDRRLADQIRGLRRPTLSAWASNLLVREQAEQVEPLLRLGESLRRAHRDLDGEQLRELSRQQHALVATLTRQARHLVAAAGKTMSEAAQRELEATLHAVLADADAAQQWASGRLTKPLTADAGFPASVPEAAGGVRVPAPRRPRGGGDTSARQRRDRALDHARREVRDAERELAAVREHAERAHRGAAEAARVVQDLERHIDALTEQINDTRARLRRANADERAAQDQLRHCDEQVQQAERRVETAAERLQGLTGEDAG
ncbi:coiled-coil domain-containing protein [Goodfellowiella coeruleoviolacea]|uniref:Uncharacterized protein n=1 Tax=Goodfellowiella coeruleoviolacea TaxID=334858 RepID=A0AAE3GFW1_9PSEU|nr:hypothetical protein [Goodfellowiella coeruleoviolacea]MCP2167461.1 hypothetical protein [Goodfellowiella coeruleoviolacea]